MPTLHPPQEDHHPTLVFQNSSSSPPPPPPPSTTTPTITATSTSPDHDSHQALLDHHHQDCPTTAPSSSSSASDTVLDRRKKKEGWAKGFIRRRIPILTWLISPGYDWHHDLTPDLFAGITVSAVIIPQSMAYALLASLPPVYGLYTSLVPTLIYAILGTSKLNSTGAFAITSLLLGQFAHKILSDQGYSESAPDGEYHRRYLPLCLGLTFLIGIIQIVLSVARLGRWTSKHLLPIALVSGFNTASAFHIGTHQFKHWLGITPPRESGIFGMFKTWIWILQHFTHDTAWPTLMMGLAAMLFMYSLQRLEYSRRAKADLASTPLSPWPASPSPTFHSNPTTPVLTSVTRRHPPQRPRYNQRRNSIVPRAVSDQALLTAEDVAIGRAGQEDDSCSSSEDSSVNSGHSTWPPRRLLRPTLGVPSGSPAGLTNTGAFGHASSPQHAQAKSPQRPNFKSVLSPSGSQGYHRPLTPDSSDEQEPLLGRVQRVHNQNQRQFSRRGSATTCRSAVSDTGETQPSPRPALQSIAGGDRQQPQVENCFQDPSRNANESHGYNAAAATEAEASHTSSRKRRLDLLKDTLSTLRITRVHFPIPDIFICVIFFTSITVLWDLDKRYNIQVIGSIPTGLPTVVWPPSRIQDWSSREWVPMIWPGILMAIIVYVMSLSVAKHFGREYDYEIDADQEMLALGVGSLVGSCFGAYACTGNLTRSAILAQMGAKTPLASIVGALMVLMTLLWFTVLFERIPSTILASIVLVALKSLMGHTVEAKRLWRVGRRKEALIWWNTFLSVMVFSIEVGLAMGMATVVALKIYKYSTRWKRYLGRSIAQSVTYQRLMLMLGLQSPLFTTGRGLYPGDDEDDDY